MSRDDLKIIGFAALICVVCSLVLSVTASSLRDRQAMNIELDRKINVLKAFGVQVVDDAGAKISAEKVEQYFSKNISEVYLDRDGKVLEGVTAVPKEEAKAKTSDRKTVLPLYVWKEADTVQKYAFPISGQGLWSTIYGYLALDKDLATVVGVTFYKHGETPGLGGEISTAAFQQQFSGKKVWAEGELLKFEVVKGSVLGKYPEGNDHAVDGITGATMTGNGINVFINRDVNAYNAYFTTVRGG